MERSLLRMRIAIGGIIVIGILALLAGVLAVRSFFRKKAKNASDRSFGEDSVNPKAKAGKDS